ncbi:MAG: ATP-binding cassette domain-containing protein [Paracoccaceae bacterium]|nr:ATP-binding cassette domain-containing protein [Paracoccaceae bacterium]MDG1369864.1 ATP-binding cassette domain-containing protein [Paracoccaceae bacterium]MDG1970867.1 ATP-binding cassette domain-containing protein [Paracoccaceae bacterium]
MFELQSASFSYGDRPVLNNVSLRLDPGSMHFLTGPSGAGKSTLMRLLYLTLRPSTGTVRVFGRDSELINRREAAEVRQRMGVVLQDCDLLDHMTVLENIALPLRIAGQKTNSLMQDLRELAAWVGLGHRLDAKPPELSSGERQRAAIARSVVNSPEVVIADEPTGNVDAAAAEWIMQLFVELNKLGKTVLIATHDMNLMRAAAGRKAYVLRIDKGRIERSGAPL